MKFKDYILVPNVHLYRDIIELDFFWTTTQAQIEAHMIDEFLESKDIHLMIGPDLNPTDHVWDTLGEDK